MNAVTFQKAPDNPSIKTHIDKPFPEANEGLLDEGEADWAATDSTDLLVGVAVGGGERRHIDGVTDGLITGGVDDVPESLLGVLDGASLWVTVPQVDELLLLPRPQPPHTLPVHLDDAEGQMAFVEHDDLVLVCPIVHYVPG